MKSFFSWIGKRVINGVVTGIFMMISILWVVYALSYPATPTGEVTWGKFGSYFTNMFGTDCTDWYGVVGFNTNGSKKCRQFIVPYEWRYYSSSACSASCSSWGTSSTTYKCYDNKTNAMVADGLCPWSNPSASPACYNASPCSVNGSCSSSPGACVAGTVSGDNNLNSCGTTRTWSCDGSSGGSNVSCSYTNVACAPPPPPPPPSNFTFTPTISANTNNYNLRTAAIAAGWDQILPLNVNVVINSGIRIGSTSIMTPAFTTGTPFPAGSSITVTNNGMICGAGGAGGAGGGSWGPFSTSAWGAGGPGGKAMNVQYAITVVNNGTIAGGGWGGWGGWGAMQNSWGAFGYGGWGGWGGRSCGVNSSGGSGGSPSGNGNDYPGGAGGVGTYAAAGAGGAGGTYVNYAGAGGAGGAFTAGGAGGDGWSQFTPPYGAFGAGGAGGARGVSATGKSYINGGAGLSGTVYGPQS